LEDDSTLPYEDLAALPVYLDDAALIVARARLGPNAEDEFALMGWLNEPGALAGPSTLEGSAPLARLLSDGQALEQPEESGGCSRPGNHIAVRSTRWAIDEMN